MNQAIPVRLHARGLEAVMQSGCERAEAVVATGETLHDAQERLQIQHTPTTSPIATFVGNQFEVFLGADKSRRLRELFAEMLTERTGTTVTADDIEQHEFKYGQDPDSPEGEKHPDPVKLAENREKFRSDVEQHLAAPSKVTLLIQPPVDVNRPDHKVSLRPDLALLYSVNGQPRFLIGEVKSQYDIGGYTAPHVVHRATLQAAYGVRALRLYLEDLTDHDPKRLVPASVALVMRGSQATARIRAISVDGELVAIDGFFKRLVARAESESYPPAFENEEQLRSVPHTFTPECVDRCPLAKSCEAEAAERGMTLRSHPGVKALEAVGVTPERAAALAAGATPVDRTERDVAKWLSS